MGILKKITDEYFGLSQRDENRHQFEKYIEKVEWVDIGHPKLLFAKTDFWDNTLETEDIFEIYDVIKKYGNQYALMTRDIFQWVLNRKNTRIESGEQKNGQDYRSI